MYVLLYGQLSWMNVAPTELRGSASAILSQRSHYLWGTRLCVMAS